MNNRRPHKIGLCEKNDNENNTEDKEEDTDLEAATLRVQPEAQVHAPEEPQGHERSLFEALF